MAEEEELSRITLVCEDGTWLIARELRLLLVRPTPRGVRRELGRRRWCLATGEALRLIDADTFMIEHSGEIVSRLAPV